MKTIWIGTAAALACMGLAGTASAQTSPPDYVARAGASDLYEIQSSKMVLGSTRNAKVRQFATRMVADHQKSTALVKAAAQKSGMQARPPALEPAQRQMIAELTQEKGDARDQLYLQQQHQAHQQALALHQGYAASGDNPDLKAAAAKIVPVVQRHIAEMPH